MFKTKIISLTLGVYLLVLLVGACSDAGKEAIKNNAQKKGVGSGQASRQAAIQTASGDASQPSGKNAQEFTLALTGDVLLASGVGDKIARYGPEYPWTEVAPVLKKADLTLVNLETSVATCGSPEPGKQYTFRSTPGSLQGLVYSGVDGVSVANNHVLDYGRKAWRETLANLDKYRLACAGTGENVKQAMKPAEFTVKGKRIAFFAFSWVLPPGWAAGSNYAGVASAYDHNPPLEVVRAAKGKYDLIIVSVHWGDERVNYPDAGQKSFGRQLVDAGADVVMGHHPHVLQGAEYYKGKVILYSLGNFVFTMRRRVTQETVIANLKFKGNRLAEVNFVPAYISSGKTEVLKGESGRQLLARLSGLCSPFHTKVDAKGNLQW